jgi:hypothetical protein
MDPQEEKRSGDLPPDRRYRKANSRATAHSIT